MIQFPRDGRYENDWDAEERKRVKNMKDGVFIISYFGLQYQLHWRSFQYSRMDILSLTLGKMKNYAFGEWYGSGSVVRVRQLWQRVPKHIQRSPLCSPCLLNEIILLTPPHPKPHLAFYIPVNPDVELSHIKRNQMVNLRCRIFS